MKRLFFSIIIVALLIVLMIKIPFPFAFLLYLPILALIYYLKPFGVKAINSFKQFNDNFLLAFGFLLMILMSIVFILGLLVLLMKLISWLIYLVFGIVIFT